MRRNKFLTLAVCLLVLAGAANGEIFVRPQDFDQVMTLIRGQVNWPSSFKPPQVDVNDRVLTFISRQPLQVKSEPPPGEPREETDDFFIIRTQFNLQSPTVEKRVMISQGRDEEARFRLILRPDGQGAFKQFLDTDMGFPVQIYDRAQEMVVYAQVPDASGGAELKEWIYARTPNCAQGSRYSWMLTSEEFFRRLVLMPGPEGTIEAHRHVVIQGVDPLDYAKQRHIIETIHKAWPSGKFHIRGEDIVAQIPPVFYVTREGRRKRADFDLAGRDELVLQIHEPASSYPILIES